MTISYIWWKTAFTYAIGIFGLDCFNKFVGVREIKVIVRSMLSKGLKA